MRNKKNSKVDIENRKTSFFLSGLILAIGATITIINLEWSQKKMIVEYDDPTIEMAVEISPTITKVAPKVRQPIAEVSEKIIIKKIIETPSEEPIVKLEKQPEVTDGVIDSNFVPVEIIEIVEDEDEVVPFVFVEKYPTFSDCGDVSTKDEQKACFEQGLLNHISSNFKYPHRELEMGLEEKVYVEFVISKKGEVSQVEIVRGNMDGFIKESKRLINTLPKVKPAEQRGKPVNMKYTIPIKFKIK